MGANTTATVAPPTAAPINIWEAMGRDLKSPIYRLWRLEAFLCTLHTALERECDQALDNNTLLHLGTVSEFCFQESECVAGDLEHWLKGNDRSKETPFSDLWKQMNRADDGPLVGLFDLQSLLSTLHTALESQQQSELESPDIQHLSLTAKFCWKLCGKIGGDLEDWTDKDQTGENK